MALHHQQHLYVSVHLQACLRGNGLELGGSVDMSFSIAGILSMPEYASFYVAQNPMGHQTCSRYGRKARFSRLRARSAELGFPCNSNEQHGIRAAAEWARLAELCAERERERGGRKEARSCYVVTARYWIARGNCKSVNLIHSPSCSLAPIGQPTSLSGTQVLLYSSVRRCKGAKRLTWATY